MKHILFISHARGLHGAERVLVQAVKACVAFGARVTVVMPSIVPDEGLEKVLLSIRGVQILSLPYRAAGIHYLRTQLVLAYNFPTLLRLKKFVEHERVDMIYSNSVVTVLGVELSLITGVRHVWHWHEPVSPLYGWHFSLKSLYRRWVSYTHTVLCISHRMCDEWQAMLQTPFRAEVVYDPVRTVTPKKNDIHSTLRIGYVGQYEQRKNIPMLIHAFSRFHRINSNSELWICGAKDKAEKARWETTYDIPSVCFERHIDDVASFYQAIDILALPSLSESWGLVAIEAMQAGVCVLMTSVSALSELYTHGEDCLFLSPEDEQAWVEAFDYCTDERVRTTIAQNGQAKTKALNFTEHFDHQIQTLLCK